jgi:hypothetical protein
MEEMTEIVKSGKKKRTRKLVELNGDEIHDVNFNWKDVGISTKSELTQIWVTGCSFLMDLPSHISSFSEYIQGLFSYWIYLLYGSLFDKIFIDIQLVKQYNLDIHWANLLKLSPTVKQYCLTKIGLTNKSPKSLIEFVDIIRTEKQQIDFKKLNEIIDEITLNKTNELWDSILLIRKRKVHIDGKLLSFYRAINPLSFTKMLDVIDTHAINVVNMLKNIEQTSVHAVI